MAIKVETGIPQILLETSDRATGWIGLTGGWKSGLEALVAGLHHHLAARRPAVVANETGSVLPHGKGVLSIPAVTEFSPEGSRQLREARVILVEGEFQPARVELYLGLAEEGRLIVWAQRAPGNMHFLRRLLSLPYGEGRAHKIWRFADQLQMLLSQGLLEGVGGEEQVAAHEVYLMTPILRRHLQNEDLAAFEELIMAGEETSGTVSLNQCLLQLLLRRRIDIKTAFEATRDPVHLDQILKKVGI